VAGSVHDPERSAALTRPSDEEILEYLDELAPILCLGHWRWKVDPDGGWLEPAHREKSFATIDVIRAKNSARIWFDDDLFEEDAEEQTRAFVHELIHCHLEPMRWLMMDMAGELDSKARDLLLTNALMDRLETATDDIARSLSPFMPIPPWFRLPIRRG
jgi:hypothetical protein